MNPSKDPLLQPFQLKHLTLKNRVMSTSHAPAYVDNGKPQERYQRYHEEKAKGGLALSMFGGSSNVSPDSPSVFGQIYMDDGVIPHFQRFTERMHAHDCALMCQLTHMGRRTTWADGWWLPVVAPSRVREPAHRSFPREMDTDDIARVVRDFSAAARRCQDGGLDGLELLCHGHLLDQFLTPLVNRRTDGYGGSLKNRMRFSLEVLDEVRRQVGPDYIVGVRMGLDEAADGGLGPDELREIAEGFVATGMVDFLNLNVGTIETDRALAHMIPGMAGPIAPHLARVKEFKQGIGVPVFHACRVTDVATARHAIQEDCMDMVGMTRAHIADPYIVSKIAAGAEETVRPCVGAGYCLDRIYEGGSTLCIHNAATGREETMPQVIEPSSTPGRKVVVVGGGPAGLEAARVSAERGHRVVLFDAAPGLGGQIVIAAKAGWRKDLIGIRDWYAAELERLGVEVRSGVYAEAEDVEAESPDVVIIAAGGIPDTECVAGGELAVSTWDVLTGAVPPGDSVLVFDDNGQHPGPSCADFMADGGASVELVTPDRMAAAEMGALNWTVYLEHIYGKGIRVTPDTRLERIEADGNRLRATLRNAYSDSEETRTVDQVVVEHGTLPMTEVFDQLRAKSANNGTIDLDAVAAGRPQDLSGVGDGGFVLWRVGDAAASRNIHAAIFDSLRLCKDL